jgi:hypothetical protein
MTMQRPARRFGWMSALLLTSLVAALGTAAAQDRNQAPNLVPTNNEKTTWRHELARTTFNVPKGWEVVSKGDVKDHQMVRMSVLHVRRGDLGVDVTLTWVPVYVLRKTNDPAADRMPDVREAFKEELAGFQLLYGTDKVTEGTPIAHPNGRWTAQTFRVMAGPRRNDKEEGFVLMFDSGPDDKNRWKVQMRANFQKKGKDDNVTDRINLVTEMFKQNFQW